MTKEIIINDSEYAQILQQAVSEIQTARATIARQVNTTVNSVYWNIGKLLFDRNLESGYGSGVVKRLSVDLKEQFPDMGLSPRNLWDMKRFYERYKTCDSKLRQAVAVLPWGHNLLLIEKIKDKDIRQIYAENTIKNGWSRNVLAIQIETEFHKRVGNSNNNFNVMLPPKDSDLVNNTIKDPYIFDFITLKEEYKEKELEEALIIKIRNVLLELGKGFSFVGNQYKISVDNQDYYIDLLFYHLELRCYVVVELKAGEFKPEYIGQLGFYVTAINETIKKECDAPTIGLLLCRGKNRVTVDWSLKSTNVPIGVSTYKLKEQLPKELIDKLPTEEEINLYLNVEEGED